MTTSEAQTQFEDDVAFHARWIESNAARESAIGGMLANIEAATELLAEPNATEAEIAWLEAELARLQFDLDNT
jgi:hypothetical protein